MAAPSQRSIRFLRPVYAQIRSKTELRIRAAMSTIVMDAKDNGVIIEDNPRISIALNTLEPNMLPSANCSFPLIAAVRLVASSGREVPPARIVTAINLSLTPICRARAVALSTNKSPPKMRPARPVRVNAIALGKDRIACCVYDNSSFESDLKQ